MNKNNELKFDKPLTVIINRQALLSDITISPENYFIYDLPVINVMPKVYRKFIRDIIVNLNQNKHNKKAILYTTNEFVLKELNNIVMFSELSENAQEDFNNKYGAKYDSIYPTECTIRHTDIRCYYYNADEDVKEYEIDEYGINTEELDCEICKVNETANILGDYLDDELDD